MKKKTILQNLKRDFFVDLSLKFSSLNRLLTISLPHYGFPVEKWYLKNLVYLCNERFDLSYRVRSKNPFKVGISANLMLQG
jgi:hypothetical protein